MSVRGLGLLRLLQRKRPANQLRLLLRLDRYHPEPRQLPAVGMAGARGLADPGSRRRSGGHRFERLRVDLLPVHRVRRRRWCRSRPALRRDSDRRSAQPRRPGLPVSLSTWLRDYLYIPLGGNRKGTAKTYRNLMLTMLLGGLWHGAAWTFVVWGGLHGLYLIVHRQVRHITKKDPTDSFEWARFATCLRHLQSGQRSLDLLPGRVVHPGVRLSGRFGGHSGRARWS